MVVWSCCSWCNEKRLKQKITSLCLTFRSGLMGTVNIDKSGSSPRLQLSFHPPAPLTHHCVYGRLRGAAPTAAVGHPSRLCCCHQPTNTTFYAQWQSRLLKKPLSLAVVYHLMALDKTIFRLAQMFRAFNHNITGFAFLADIFPFFFPETSNVPSFFKSVWIIEEDFWKKKNTIRTFKWTVRQKLIFKVSSSAHHLRLGLH